MIFAHQLYLIQISKRLGEMVMREKIQLGAACVANALIYAGDLYDAVLTALELLVGVLL